MKCKLRRIGNSMGVILPANVITGYNKGDGIEIDVITKAAKVGNVITPIGVLANPEAAEVITNNHAKFDKKTTKPPQKNLAPDGHPIQHTNPMKVGYVPASGR